MKTKIVIAKMRFNNSGIVEFYAIDIIVSLVFISEQYQINVERIHRDIPSIWQEFSITGGGFPSYTPPEGKEMDLQWFEEKFDKIDKAEALSFHFEPPNNYCKSGDVS